MPISNNVILKAVSREYVRSADKLAKKQKVRIEKVKTHARARASEINSSIAKSHAKIQDWKDSKVERIKTWREGRQGTKEVSATSNEHVGSTDEKLKPINGADHIKALHTGEAGLDGRGPIGRNEISDIRYTNSSGSSNFGKMNDQRESDIGESVDFIDDIINDTSPNKDEYALINDQFDALISEIQTDSVFYMEPLRDLLDYLSITVRINNL